MRRRRSRGIARYALAAAFSLLFGILLGYAIMLAIWTVLAWH